MERSLGHFVGGRAHFRKSRTERDQMGKAEKPKPKGRKPPEGDKRQFLTTMDPKVIKSIKLAAIEADTTASAILELAAMEWLERHVDGKK